MVYDSNGETNVPDKLSLTDRQVSRLPKAFTNSSSANIEVSKTQFSKIVQSGGFRGILIGPLAKCVLVPLRLTTTALAANTGIHKNSWGQGRVLWM